MNPNLFQNISIALGMDNQKTATDRNTALDCQNSDSHSFVLSDFGMGNDKNIISDRLASSQSKFSHSISENQITQYSDPNIILISDTVGLREYSNINVPENCKVNLLGDVQAHI